jgi:hypothetical protein
LKALELQSDRYSENLGKLARLFERRA